MTDTVPADTARVDPGQTFAVVYRYVPDMQSRREPHRAAHLAWLRALAADGVVLLAGALQDPVDAAILVFRAEDGLAVRRLLLDDPYASAELISEVAVRPIGLAVGPSGSGDQRVGRPSGSGDQRVGRPSGDVSA